MSDGVIERVQGEVVESRHTNPGDEVWIDNRWVPVLPEDFDEDDEELILRRSSVQPDRPEALEKAASDDAERNARVEEYGLRWADGLREPHEIDFEAGWNEAALAAARSSSGLAPDRKRIVRVLLDQAGAITGMDEEREPQSLQWAQDTADMIFAALSVQEEEKA